jgi:protein Tex
MKQEHIKQIANELNLEKSQVHAVALFLQEKATIPFIARYRKEATKSLDEIVITKIRNRLDMLEKLDLRKIAILNSLERHGHLTDELQEKIINAPTIADIEDTYLPYRPKRRTKAAMAKEKGLEPLALTIFEQRGTDPVKAAQPFLDEEKGIESSEDALSGARDIIAEIVNEDSKARTALRKLFTEKGTISTILGTNVSETKGAKYKDYFNWEEPASTAPSHRILAMRRGEQEFILNLSIAPPKQEAMEILNGLFLKGKANDSIQVSVALSDSYKRLLSRSLETEARLAIKQRADDEAIRVFALNLSKLLMAPPLEHKRVMGIDPGLRTGCKIACLDSQGKLLEHDTIYLKTSDKKTSQAAQKIKKFSDQFKIQAIAIGNGTGGRETQAFIKDLKLSEKIHVVMVNESGASVYSASETARKEFPDLDLTIRGAVSIARRLMDPLAELVKIDPKSIGVGQYQHDVDQAKLRQSLDDVVTSCVNLVGVDINTASPELLTYVSGLSHRLAGKIISYRNQNGAFLSRQEIKNVPGLGPKTFQQCAGFLRINNGNNPLDASAVHPETYHIVDSIARNLSTTVKHLIQNPDLENKINLSDYVTDSVGIPTLKDILKELAKPGRDPREKFETFSFADNIRQISDLKTGMKLPGIITNVTGFGAFVDIGVHHDGLVHISQLSDSYIKDPSDLVHVHQKVAVTVIDLDLERNRISLSMKS